MEVVLRHLKTYIAYYFVGFIFLVAFTVYTYRRPVKPVENFQEPSGPAVASGAPVKLPKESCIPLKSQIDQYRQVKEQHKDTRILNLDETIQSLEVYFREYGCELHTY